MKNKLISRTIPFVLATVPALVFGQPAPELKTTNEQENTQPLTAAEVTKLSQALGYLSAQNAEKQLKVDLKSFIKGAEDAMAKKPAPMEQEELFQMLQKQQKSVMDKLVEENLKAAEDFLAKNKNKPGIITLENGKLEYEVLTPGSGEVVLKTGTPLIHYEGKFIDGEIFDSSYKRGNPIPMNLESTIPGFTVGVAGMKKGEKRRLYIHPELGYGNRPGRIPPNSLLVFEIEVIEPETVKESKTAETPAETESKTKIEIK